MITAAVVSLFLQLVLKWDSDKPRDFAYLMLVTVAITTVVWVTVTMLTPAEPIEKLSAFYKRRQARRPWLEQSRRGNRILPVHMLTESSLLSF